MKLTFDKEVGARLKEFILILKISQTAFAQSIKMSRGYVSDVITGKRGAGPGIIINIAEAYKNLSLRWLLFGEGEMYDFSTIYEYPPPELQSGQTDQVQEGVKIQYLKKEGQLESMQRHIADLERRLRDLEGKK